MEEQCVQAVSPPSAGACGTRTAAGRAPRLPPLPEPGPGPQTAADPKGLPHGIAGHATSSTHQVIHSLGC